MQLMFLLIASRILVLISSLFLIYGYHMCMAHGTQLVHTCAQQKIHTPVAIYKGFYRKGCQGTLHFSPHLPTKSGAPRKHRMLPVLRTACPPRLSGTCRTTRFIGLGYEGYVWSTNCIYLQSVWINRHQSWVGLWTRIWSSPLARASNLEIRSVILDILVNIPSSNFFSTSSSCDGANERTWQL